jgi:predicted acetyltransferase
MAPLSDRLAIHRMLELYQHDLSDIWDQDLDTHGEYGYALDRYWDTEGFYPFVAIVNGKYAGFALVNQAVRIGTHGYWMDQFFVLKKYRRKGVGQLLAQSVFAALLGRWEVGQMTENHPAQAFWREVIGAYTGGRFKEHEVRAGPWQGVVQVFESTALQ